MTPDNKIALYQSALERGAMSPEQQIAAAPDFAAFIIEFRAMRTTLDEIYQQHREHDELNRREVARSLPVADVLPFPPRAVPVWLAVADVRAVDEVWR